ncbi:hypothetical protein ['Paenibacillus yunnanensis' Narsing Rao et al. 2020]|uniref:hypothetical protein n=1 Tax=Paenibacillus tengchongensis TaxID=2608684 RepID=UPI00165255E0|nr:hypothetical protein [Paenibacillus tengchongensis]
MIERIIAGGRLDPPYWPTKTYPCFVGREIQIPRTADVSRVITDRFRLTESAEVYAVSFKTDSTDFRDYWNLTVSGREVARNIHCLNYEEGLYFQVVLPVQAGQEIYFEFHTADGAARNIGIMLHLLSDPGVYLELVGTTDLGNYPDPPPELPGSGQPAYPPANGSISLPVAWSPFETASAAEAWASALGVHCNFAGKTDAANYVTEALALLFNTCGGFADMVMRYPLNINIKDGQGANGYFNPPTNEVVVSRTYPFQNAGTIAQAEYETGQKSSPHQLRTVIHEIGHWLHFHHAGESMFYQYSALDPDNYGSQTILSNADAAYISNHLCNYATKWFPIELIPETFTAKMTGVPVDSKIWEWYEQYGGFQCSGW